MKTDRNYKLQEMLRAINIIGEDTDVEVDGIDAIAVCPPVRMTPEGRKHFAEALNATVICRYSELRHEYTCVSDTDKANNKAWELLCSLAGYCPDSLFGKWFEGENAELL